MKSRAMTHKVFLLNPKKLPIVLLVFSLAFLLFQSNPIKQTKATGNTYYVAKTGCSDSSPGTEAQPWCTIQKAANTLVAGDTVYIKQGTYNEKIVPKNAGSPGNYITYTAYPDHTVIIDGADISLSPWNDGLFQLLGKSYIKISGLRIENSEWNGINIRNSDHIVIENNHIYRTFNSGIQAIYATNIIIDGNEVELAHTWAEPYSGADEAISLSVVDTFEVMNNHVHHGYKEGIDAKVSSTNGKIYNNHVHNMRNCSIYIDGGYFLQYGYPGTAERNIDVYQNVVHDGEATGIFVATESGDGWIENINVYNNIVYNCGGSGIGAFRYPGIKKDIRFVNNTVYNNGNNGVFFTNPEAEGCIIRNNIFSQNGWQITVEYGGDVGNVTVDHNLVDGYTQIYGDAAVIGDPKFINPAEGDFYLREDSPAIDSGSSIDAPSDDYKGNPRPQGEGYDIGAYEFTGCVQPTPTSTPCVQTPIFLPFVSKSRLP